MSKSKKILSLIFCILILTILIPILLDYHKVSGLELHLINWKRISFLGYYLSRYIFWGTLVLSILILLSMLVIIFYPKQHLEIFKNCCYHRYFRSIPVMVFCYNINN